MNKIYFGPAGNSESFYEQGFKKTAQAPAWLNAMGLNAFEYSFGRGVSLTKKTAEEISAQAVSHAVKLSVHAPYYINLVVNDEDRREKNFKYFMETAKAAKMLGAERMVFHPGAVSKMTREHALELARSFLKEILEVLDGNGYADLTLCPETMGKINQLGNLEEVIELCKLDDRLIPTIDFGHLHARGLGAINTIDDFRAILDALENNLGFERASNIHVHFSHIEYTAGGEKRHRKFSETEYGPDFEPLGELIAQRQWTPHIICESNGTMAEDALYMKNCYLAALARI